MSKLLLNKISEKDLKEFNKALLSMIQKLQEENDILKEKVEILEKIVKESNVRTIGE